MNSIWVNGFKADEIHKVGFISALFSLSRFTQQDNQDRASIKTEHKIPRNRSLKTALPPPHPPQAAPVHYRIKQECLEIFNVSQGHPNISAFIQRNCPTNWKTRLISLWHVKPNHPSRTGTNISLSLRFLFTHLHEGTVPGTARAPTHRTAQVPKELSALLGGCPLLQTRALSFSVGLRQ